MRATLMFRIALLCLFCLISSCTSYVAKSDKFGIFLIKLSESHQDNAHYSVIFTVPGSENNKSIQQTLTMRALSICNRGDYLIKYLVKVKHTQYPHMKAVDSAYGAASENMGFVEGLFKPNKSLGAVKSGLRNAVESGALEKIVPKETLHEAKRILAAKAFTKQTMGVVQTLIKYGVFYHALKGVLLKGGDMSDSGNFDAPSN